MANIRLTKGELKRQRDALKQYQRYLPTLQLKKQQLQIEILHQQSAVEKKRSVETAKRVSIERWAGLLTDPEVSEVVPGVPAAGSGVFPATPEDSLKKWLKPEQIIVDTKNVAGIDLPVFQRVEFPEAEYDLFLMPLWVDTGLEALRELVAIRSGIAVIEEGISILKHELRITTQRVNLFEKVKIPEAEEAIRLIKIYIGDQMTNAVGRSKMAKRKIEAAFLQEVAA